MNTIKKKAFSVLESRMLKKGKVLAVRNWNLNTFFEIDLHLPDVNMENWNSVQYIKVKVADYTYRDYTPALWEEETHTCTLCISASQNSRGSKWAASLKRGDQIFYLGIKATAHQPVPGKKILCLGDSSSVGHFLALKQLTNGHETIYGAVSFNNEAHASEFTEYFDSSLEALKEKKCDTALLSWLKEQCLTDEIVYIAGHTATSVQLRKYLKRCSDFKGTINVQGFWS
ncbi:hypothetical protein [Pedobacter sp. L105]|uniref:hypothetical protein n=1 Tax=Pedobacter sp. L105 TaxID=1641871 RepID=UPI00131BDDEE|nr:hypothetical protein [Pedobacter sp. L105]